MAHVQALRLFNQVQNVRHTQVTNWKKVGEALARIVLVHICLLLETEAFQSPTKAAVWRAQQCLKEWYRLQGLGLTEGLSIQERMQVCVFIVCGYKFNLWKGTPDLSVGIVPKVVL